ncbi:MAG TPA: type II 3-dehydroquinate dehydratase [Pseudomonadales bacterium]
MPAILVLHGPNLNLLGSREPGLYGRQTLAAINASLQQQAEAAGFGFRCLQSNAEHVLIEAVHQTAADDTAFMLLNPAAFTHTSVALRDAILAVQLPFIEVHLSNVHAREPFRQHSYFSDIAVGVISGLAADSYTLAMQAAINHLNHHNNNR